MEVIRFRYTINFNLSSEISDEIGLALNVSDASESLHCSKFVGVNSENIVVNLDPNYASDGYGDTFGFVQSGEGVQMCSLKSLCTILTSQTFWERLIMYCIYGTVALRSL